MALYLLDLNLQDILEMFLFVMKTLLTVPIRILANAHSLVFLTKLEEVVHHKDCIVEIEKYEKSTDC